jgi:hypothetical protein
MRRVPALLIAFWFAWVPYSVSAPIGGGTPLKIVFGLGYPILLVASMVGASVAVLRYATAPPDEKPPRRSAAWWWSSAAALYTLSLLAYAL